MAGTLKVKIEEDIILNNQNYGSKRTLSIASVTEIYKMYKYYKYYLYQGTI